MISRRLTLAAVAASLMGCASAGQSFDSEPASCRASVGDGPVRASVEFVNRSSEAKSLSWVTPAGTIDHYRDLAPGESQVQSTYVGHVWMVSPVSGGPSSTYCVQLPVARKVIE